MSAEREVHLLGDIEIDPTCGLPLYRQLENQICERIRNGAYGAGERVAGVHDVAKRLGLSVSTVSRAFSDLSKSGVLVSQRGRGTFINRAREGTTEILIPRTSSSGSGLQTGVEELSPFFRQLLDGTKSGFKDETRRYCVSFLDGGEFSAEEVLGICRLRGADGLMIYRPSPIHHGALRQVAQEVPVVSIFERLGDFPADSVETDVEPVLQRVLETRLSEGCENFAFVGYEGVLYSNRETVTPYERMMRAFEKSMAAAGKKAEVRICKETERRLALAAMEDVVADLPDGAVTVFTNPDIAEAADPEKKGMDVISYTESETTRARYIGRMTLLYMGLERAGEAGAELLVSRNAAGGRIPARSLALKPEVLWKG